MVASVRMLYTCLACTLKTLSVATRHLYRVSSWGGVPAGRGGSATLALLDASEHFFSSLLKGWDRLNRNLTSHGRGIFESDIATERLDA